MNSYRVAQFVFVVTEETRLTVTPEVASYFWVPMSTLTDPTLVETIRLEREDIRLRCQAFVSAITC